MTQYLKGGGGGTKHFFLLILYNFKNIWGGGGMYSAVPVLISVLSSVEKSFENQVGANSLLPARTGFSLLYNKK